MSVPRVKRMNKKGRLAHARSTDWIKKNAGAKNIIRRYRRYFGVDHIAAALELRALGVAITEARLAQLRGSAASIHRALHQKKVRERRAKEEELKVLEDELARCWPVWRDDPFPFPVGGSEVAAADFLDGMNDEETFPYEAADSSELQDLDLNDAELPF